MVAVRKIVGDLRYHWRAVILLFIAVAAGQSAMTAAFMARSVVAGEIDRNFRLAKAPHASVEAAGIGADLPDRLAGTPGVRSIDALSTLAARYRLADGTWRPIVLFGRRDFADLRVARVFLKSGRWPRLGEIAIERSGLGLLEQGPGRTLHLGFGSGQRADVRFAGVVHDPARAPSWQEDALYGYVGLDQLAAMAGPRPIQFVVRLEPGATGAEVTRALAARISEAGARVTRINTLPAAHPHADLMQGLLMLLSIFSVLSFILAMFLSGSIVASLVNESRREVGVLRALGAARLRIAFLLLGFVAVPATLGLLAAALLGEALAQQLAGSIAWQLNLELSAADYGRSARDWLFAAGVAGVLVAITLPVARFLRRPIRELLQQEAIGTRAGRLRLRPLSPLNRLAVAEAFRSRLGSALAIVALTSAGIALLAASNTYVSLVAAVDRVLASRRDDFATTAMNQPDLRRLESELRAIDGLRSYELWDVKSVSLATAEGPGIALPMVRPPDGTRMGVPPIVEGRWPSRPGEVAVSRLALAHGGQANLSLGGEVGLSAGERSTRARIVGLVDEFGMSIWTNEATFARLAGPQDRARQIRAIAAPGDVAPVVVAVERSLINAGSFPAATVTRATRRLQIVNHYYAFFQFLIWGSMAAMIVGAAALSSSIGSSVAKRTRELGVVRAIGGTRTTLMQMVLGQALALSVLSFVLAVAIAIPLSMLVVWLLESRALRMSLPLHLSWTAIAGLAGGSILVAVLAAIGPTFRIQRMPVRSAIAHE